MLSRLAFQCSSGFKARISLGEFSPRLSPFPLFAPVQIRRANSYFYASISSSIGLNRKGTKSAKRKLPSALLCALRVFAVDRYVPYLVAAPLRWVFHGLTLDREEIDTSPQPSPPLRRRDSAASRSRRRGSGPPNSVVKTLGDGRWEPKSEHGDQKAEIRRLKFISQFVSIRPPSAVLLRMTGVNSCQNDNSNAFSFPLFPLKRIAKTLPIGKLLP